MTKDNGFTILPRKEIPAALQQARPIGKYTQALLEGQAVFFPGATSKDVAGKGATARKHGYKVHTRTGERDGVQGVYLWADKE